MPYVITTTTYPTHKATEVADKYFEMLKAYPPDRALEKELVPAAVITNDKGIIVVNVALAKAGKLEELLTRTGKAMAMFQPIEGLEYSIRVWSTVVEALDTLGMKLPE